jgi:uncharacterized membrane protein (Fun14 family)
VSSTENEISTPVTPKKQSGLRNYVGTMPRWKKIAVGTAACSFVLALLFLFFEDGQIAPAAPDPGDGSTLPATLVDPGTGRPLPPDSASTDVDTAWSSVFFRYGFSFFVGFALGYATRTFLKVLLIAVGTFAVGLFLLSYGGFVTVEWNAIDGAFEQFTEGVKVQAGAFRTFIAGSLPNAGLAGLGMYSGFRKN